jgi:deoxyribose-phosphate aldolase
MQESSPSSLAERLAPQVRLAVETAGGPLERLLPQEAAGPQLAQAERLPGLIDQILLKPEATAAQVERTCHQALEYGFAVVCVNAAYLGLTSRLLAGSGVRPGGVVAFPLGASLPVLVAAEAEQLIALGARELDMVVQVGALVEGDYTRAAADVRAVVQVAHPAGVLVKLILETALLTPEQKVAGCLLAALCGADFVKTSTGFGPGGATLEDVRLMRAVAGPKVGVKAAGGIRTLEAALRMVEAGASRLGTSSGVTIVEQIRSRIPAAAGAEA